MNPSLRDKLNHVKATENDSIDLGLFPDFLIIGPQRTGTTWLHANLREHPEVFLAEPKELFFFSRLKTPDDPKFQSDRLEWYLSFFRHKPVRRLYKTWMCFRHYRRFYNPKVSGEATASYAALDPDVIAEIAALNPNLKVLMMVRDPVERAWSHAKKDLARNRGRKVTEVPVEEFEEFLSSPYQMRCSRYRENLDNWLEHFPKEQVFVGLFDEIESSPEALLRRVMQFLGVDDRFVGRLARSQVNPTGHSSIPEKHRNYLDTLLAEELRSYREDFLGKD